MHNVARKTILQLVEENYTNASVLHFFGIAFYNFTDQTLEQVCKMRNLDIWQVITHLYQTERHRNYLPESPSAQYPVEVIISYLKSAHQFFIRHRLPYVTDLICNIKAELFHNRQIAEDLKFVFPIFYEDFVRHIRHEEASLFTYIQQLSNAVQGKFNLTRMYYAVEKHAISHFAEEHHNDNDEMEGIRLLTDGYRIGTHTTPYEKVIFAELQQFEKELQIHAAVEEDILLPKALQLEKRVCKMIDKKAKLN